MSPSDYTEELLVEQPAVDLFAELGWATVSANEEVFGVTGTLGRETKSEVVLIPKLRAALEQLNPALPADAINSAIDELARDRSAMSIAAANRDVWDLLRDGVTVSVPDLDRGGLKTERVRVIDWERPEANDFLVVSQMTITGELYTCRPDLVGFVNGLPLVVIEVKKPGVPAQAGLRRKPDELQAFTERNSRAVLVQRAFDRFERRRQPRGFADGGLGSVYRMEANRTRGRAAAGIAGGDAAGFV